MKTVIKLVAMLAVVLSVSACSRGKGMSAGSRYATALGELVDLKMEFAYKEGQKDALAGKFKIRTQDMPSANDPARTFVKVDEGWMGSPGNAGWEWTASPWDGDKPPHSPELVDAHNDRDILDKLARARR